MGHRDRILAAIAEVGGPICDDCLSARAGITPRQQVFAICARLASTNAITREVATCDLCAKTKKSSRSHDGRIADPLREVAAAAAPSRLSRPAPGAFNGSGDEGDRPWHWEGHVQEVLQRYLAAHAWTITATADTESKEPGIDLVATKDGRWLAVEVKGYPTTVYDHGKKRGQPKPTQPTSQARQWFSHALLSIMRLRHKRPDAEIALCFPDFRTYRSLAAQTRRCFDLLGFGIYFVGKDGSVQLDAPHRTVAP